jgi:hypothetical protein
VEWSEQLSPCVTVAKLRIPQQDISGEDNLAKMDALSFSPWRVTTDHAPPNRSIKLAQSSGLPERCLWTNRT